MFCVAAFTINSTLQLTDRFSVSACLLQSVLFVSSREVRLCSTFLLPSTPFFFYRHLASCPRCLPKGAFACAACSFLLPDFRRDANHSKACVGLARGFKKVRAMNLRSRKPFNFHFRLFDSMLLGRRKIS